MIPYKQQPKDAGGEVMTEFATPFKALVTSYSDSAIASSVITLSDSCSTIEVQAGQSPVALKWITTGDTGASVISAAGTADFDNVIPQNYFRRFAVPIEAMVRQASIVGINKQYGLYNRVALKTFGVGSVMLTQY